MLLISQPHKIVYTSRLEGIGAQGAERAAEIGLWVGGGEINGPLSESAKELAKIGLRWGSRFWSAVKLRSLRASTKYTLLNLYNPHPHRNRASTFRCYKVYHARGPGTRSLVLGPLFITLCRIMAMLPHVSFPDYLALVGPEPFAAGPRSERHRATC